ncbi:hypothetical protein J7J26_03525 [Candidatus Micrarchaeota archaeon]|nr:hypothetical protein [Candidatus Micrarchaeota archaeon]
MKINVYILTSPFDMDAMKVYKSLITLSKKKNLKGKIIIKKIMSNSERGQDIMERFDIEETPAIIIGNMVVSEGDVPKQYLHDVLVDIIEDNKERTDYIY